MGSNVYKNTTIRIKHDQSSAATTWTIVHGLNTTSPIVDVYTLQSGSYKQMMPLSVIVVDSATVEVNFSAATAGYAMVM